MARSVEMGHGVAMGPRSPTEIRSVLAQAARLIQQGQAGEAERVCGEALAVAPDSPDAHYMLAVARHAQGRSIDAIAACDRALAISENFHRARLQKAQCLMSMGRRSEAVAEAEAIVAANPTDAFSLNAIAVTFTKAGRHEGAVEFYERAAKAGGAPRHYFNLAAALEVVGRFEEAREAYRRCLKSDPHNAPAWWGLVQITRQSAHDNVIDELEKAFAAARGDPARTQDLGHALAKAWEDLGDTQEAMGWLERGKAGMRKASKHTPEKDRALFAAAQRSICGAVSTGQQKIDPIFVVGLPRTGTTLVERILSNHSEVETAGELPDFPEAIRAVADLRDRSLFSTEIVEASRVADPGQVGERYASAVRERLKLAGRFVDKLPVNFFLVPAILKALPDARVICVRRHPADALLANYRQSFARGARYLDSALDLDWSARYVAQFERLAGHWNETLRPDRYREIRYEDIVRDLKGQVRDLLSFCDLPFEQACVDFHQNAAPVATASAAQVRQPLYATSVDKWRTYRPAIDEAVRKLVKYNAIQRSEFD